MTKITASFLASFKIGDNIHYNLSVLKALYKAQSQVALKDEVLFEKPITLLLVSICEVIIYDFIKRSKILTFEGIQGLTENQLSSLKESKAWSMEKKIQLFKDINVLQMPDNTAYEYLDNLSKLRNRIHIQNENQNFEADEIKAFTKSRRIKAEQMVELLMKKISLLYPRPEHIKKSLYVEDFELPWDSHFE